MSPVQIRDHPNALRRHPADMSESNWWSRFVRYCCGGCGGTLIAMMSAAHAQAHLLGKHNLGVPRLPWAAVPAGAVVVVLVVAAGLWLKELGSDNSDRALVDLVRQARTPALDVLALVLRYGLSIPVAIGCLVVTGTVLWVRDRHPRRAAAFVSLAVPGWLATGVVKTVVERPRPQGVALFGQLQEVGPHSFPSAHAAIGAGVGCAVVLVFCWPRGAVARVAGVVLGVGFAVAAGWSRVYLGVHHPGDVLGSIALTVAAELIWLPVLARLLHPPRDTIGHDGVELRRSARR